MNETVAQTETIKSTAHAQARVTLNSQVKRQISRDEMNLAEFPLTVLSTRSNPNIKTLQFKDTITDRAGKVTKREWIITGADKFGLPTASDDEVLLGLLKLSVDDEFRSRKVFFTRYELLRVLRWTTEGRSYTRLQNALDRLSGVRIKAMNAFFDNEAKSHSTKNFGIIDAYEIHAGRDSQPKPSFFIWSEEIFKSFSDGFIKKLDLSFYLDLKSAISKRLYRYLDKHFWYKARVSLNLFTLAHEKLGVSRNYRFASSIRQQLDPAVEELIQAGFLSNCEYQGQGSSTDVIFYSGSGMAKVKALEESTPGKRIPRGPSRAGTGQNFKLAQVSSSDLEPEQRGSEGSIDNSSKQTESQGPSLYKQVFERLKTRGIREVQIERLLSGQSEVALGKIASICDYYDFLLATKSRLVSISPVGFLYRAVERAETFILPKSINTEQNCSSQRSQHSAAAVRVTSESKTAIDQLFERYIRERSQQVKRLKHGVEPSLLDGLTAEVEEGLQSVRKTVSEQRFREAVEHQVEERLAKLFALPDFEEWKVTSKSKTVVG